MPLNITLTDAGIAEVINAVNTGTDPVLISEIGVGDGQYTPSSSQTALVNEIKRISTIAGSAVADDTISVTLKDETADIYSVGEIGLFTDSGTLLAVYSQTSGNGWIVEKASPAVLLIVTDIILASINASSLTFGDVSFLNPPATETVQGVAEIATQAETDAGTDDMRIVTPLKLKNAVGTLVPAATTTAQGKVELATNAETQTGTDANRAVTPAGLVSRTATESRSGLAELATQTETNTGTDDARIVTPLKLKTFFDNLVKAATTTIAGLVELATDAETQTGSDATRAVTPASLASRTATETRTGIAELATDAETQAGADDARIVTPLKLKNAINALVPTASTTQAGKVELATNAETQTGTDATRAVTPAGLASRTASTTVQGLVELATSTEVQTGTDTTRAVTPSGLAARTATETRTGIAELATQAETNAGTDDARIVTPKKLRAGFAVSLAANGYIALPSWLGGLIIQWGKSGNIAGNSSALITLPITFPNAILSVVTTKDSGASASASGSGTVSPTHVYSVNTANFRIVYDPSNTEVSTPVFWIALGY